MDTKYPWQGASTYSVQVRLTEAERKEVDDICQRRGGVPMARYFRMLHHKAMGRLEKEQKEDG